MAKILNSQESIGWELLKFGFISKDWAAAQLEHAKVTDPNHSQCSSDRWTRQTQYALWNYTSSIWEHKNKAVKGDTRAQRDLAVHRQLATEVANIIANPPDVGLWDVYLFSIQDMSKKRLHYMRHWLQVV